MRGLGDFVEGVVELLLLAQHDSEGEAQRGILVVRTQRFAKLEFGVVKMLLVRLDGGFR